MRSEDLVQEFSKLSFGMHLLLPRRRVFTPDKGVNVVDFSERGLHKGEEKKKVKTTACGRGQNPGKGHFCDALFCHVRLLDDRFSPSTKNIHTF